MITAGETFGIYFGGQVCGEGSPAAGGSVSPEGRSEAEAHQEEPHGDGGVERRLFGRKWTNIVFWQIRLLL